MKLKVIKPFSWSMDGINVTNFIPGQEVSPGHRLSEQWLKMRYVVLLKEKQEKRMENKLENKVMNIDEKESKSDDVKSDKKKDSSKSKKKK